MRRIVPFLVGSALLLSLLADCKRHPPKHGDPCSSDGAVKCVDPKTKLTCVSGKWAVAHCESCVKETSSGLGTESTVESFRTCQPGGVGPEGAACGAESYDCSDDGKEAVTCDPTELKYHHFKCDGPKGCTRGAKGTSCDNSTATKGDVCLAAFGSACTPDKKEMLDCTGGVYVVRSECGGPKGCRLEDDRVTCDLTVSALGGACRSGGGCSPDGKDLVHCVDGKFVLNQRCRGKDERCVTDPKTAESGCVDMYAGAVGDPCEGDDNACTVDGHAMLECKGGVYVVKTTCKTCKGDDPSPGKLTCRH